MAGILETNPITFFLASTHFTFAIDLLFFYFFQHVLMEWSGYTSWMMLQVKASSMYHLPLMFYQLPPNKY